VGAEIWRLIQTPTTVADIVSALVDMYDVDAARCRMDVISLVAALRDRRLVDVRGAK